uniref:Secreted protein n=1 Tax=Globodera pallida TaxID=36090 RepID=A0A183C6K2_GLOPA
MAFLLSTTAARLFTTFSPATQLLDQKKEQQSTDHPKPTSVACSECTFQPSSTSLASPCSSVWPGVLELPVSGRPF